MTVQSVADVRLSEPDDRSYRSIMTSGDTKWITRVVAREASEWLSEKGIAADVTDDLDIISDTASLTARHVVEDSRRSLRVVLTERQPAATWTTEILAADRDGARSWLQLVVRNDAGKFVSRPRVADALMRALPLGDGKLRFSADPQVITSRQIPALVDLLLDPTRNGMVFVTAPAPDTPLQPLVEMVGLWTREVRGLAQVVVLEHSATKVLADALGPSHAVAPLTIRGFLPGIDLDNAVDARRHRVLSTASLATMSSGAVRSILGRAARTQASQRMLPDAVYEVRRLFQRIDARQVIERIPRPEPATELAQPLPPVKPRLSTEMEQAPTPTEPPDSAAPVLDELALVREVLGLATIDREALERIAGNLAKQHADRDWAIAAAHEIEVQEAKIETLEDEGRERERAYEGLQLDFAISDADRARLSDEVRWLRSRLALAKDFDAAYGQPPEAAVVRYPESFTELASRIDELQTLRLVYTGDRKDIVDLDPFDSLGTMAHFTWEALLALADYRRCRAETEFKVGVHDYLKQPPPEYRAVSVKRHAARESEATMNQYGNQRIFAVPVEVHPSRRATMQAHFKLGWVGDVSPRLHYLDDVTNSGCVVVGYLGRHLPIASL